MKFKIKIRSKGRYHQKSCFLKKIQRLIAIITELSGDCRNALNTMKCYGSKASFHPKNKASREIHLCWLCLFARCC